MSTQAFAPVNGAQLYYETSGDGHPLLLIHAGVADSRMWDDQFDDFAGQFRTIRYDMQGFGRSEMAPNMLCNHEDVRALLDYLEVERAHIIGTSFGGLVAIDFALAFPDRVSALILGAPSVSGALPSERIRNFWAEEENAMDRDAIDHAVELNMRMWVDGPFRSPEQVDEHVRRRVAIMQKRAFEVPEPDEIDEIELEPPAFGRLGQIQAPTVVTVGTLDLEEKVDQAKEIADAIPGAQFLAMDGVAHMLTMEAPAQFRDLALTFLSQR